MASTQQLVDSLISEQPVVPPDLSLINELYETIEQSPPAIEVRKLLIQHLIACGWVDAARDNVSNLLKLDPSDSEAQLLSQTLRPEGGAVSATVKPSRSYKGGVANTEIKDISTARAQLSSGYKSLFSKARVLHWEMNMLRGMFQEQPKKSSVADDILSTFDSENGTVEGLAEGRLHSSRNGQPKPPAARTVARKMEKDHVRALDIAIQDLTDTAHWLRSAKKYQLDGGVDDDAVREALVKRTQALVSALPREMQRVASTAQMHIEHEVLRRTYICSETMYGDPVSEIPRNKFWVSEDGYPWDMEELAQAITSNGGVMRNPLSRQLFTPSDVKAIISHPLGKPLAALQLAQDELSQGIRPQTIDHLSNMSTVLLGDDSADQIPSRHVLDEFLAYVATLPDAEQTALDGLRVPAKDSHTGMAFDGTIGDAVRDAQGNRVCIHKIGDFLGQAAKHLRRDG